MQREIRVKVRNKETDVIKKLVVYATKQGSRSPNKLYLVYSKLVNAELSIKGKSRDTLSALESKYVSSCELLISKLLIDLMAQDIHYKTIYQIIKKKLHMYINTLVIDVDTVANNSSYIKS